MANLSRLVSKGQATTIQVLMFVAVLSIAYATIFAMLYPLTRINASAYIASYVASKISECEGITSLAFNQHVTVTLYLNGTVEVKTRSGIGIARVYSRRLIPSSASGYVIYIFSDGKYAWVSSKP